MKRHHLILFTLLFSLFCTPSVYGQNKPCNNFDCAYKKAENFLKQAAYQKALDNLDSAEGYLTDINTKEKEQIKQLHISYKPVNQVTENPQQYQILVHLVLLTSRLLPIQSCFVVPKFCHQ
jgi:hypothetical protein